MKRLMLTVAHRNTGLESPVNRQARKPALQVLVLAMLSVPLMAGAQKGTLRFNETNTPVPPPEPPPVYQNAGPDVLTAPRTPAAGQTYVYDQRPIGARSALLTAEDSNAILNRFKTAYAKLGNPRLLIYVNRELVDEASGLKLIKRQERTESTRDFGTNGTGSVRSVGRNTYRSDGKAAPTLADKQTVRDVERLFGRPLRAAGASLADQRVAAQLIADRPLEEFIGSSDTPQSRKDREALGQIADAVIEILISSKTITVPAISGDQTLTIPDIQATAIRLKDAKILGQAASTDVTSRAVPAALRNASVQEISEATALALMDDMAGE